MRVRFGFVAISLSLTHASPSQAMTYKTFTSIPDREAALQRATRIAESNLENTLRILRHADASGVHVYRLTSKLVPLFGHPDIQEYDFLNPLREALAQLGGFVRQRGMRVSFHPDHFTVLNSPKVDVVANSIGDLQRHLDLFEAMGLDANSKMNIHIGGAYGDKPAALQRFAHNWLRVPAAIQQRVTLENDDKTFTARETLTLCTQLGVPMVLDIHHHACNHNPDTDANAQLAALTPAVFQTWNSMGNADVRAAGSAGSASADVTVTGGADDHGGGPTVLPPKVHVSSPKSENDFRAHADDVNPADLLPFLDIVRAGTNTDIDVMLEAKRKDEALFTLMKALELIDSVHIIDGGSIEYRP